MDVRTLHGKVVVTMDPRDAHSLGCYLASLIQPPDHAIHEAHDIIREAHVFRVCPPMDPCPFPLYAIKEDEE